MIGSFTYNDEKTCILLYLYTGASRGKDTKSKRLKSAVNNRAEKADIATGILFFREGIYLHALDVSFLIDQFADSYIDWIEESWRTFWRNIDSTNQADIGPVVVPDVVVVDELAEAVEYDTRARCICSGDTDCHFFKGQNVMGTRPVDDVDAGTD